MGRRITLRLELKTLSIVGKRAHFFSLGLQLGKESIGNEVKIAVVSLMWRRWPVFLTNLPVRRLFRGVVSVPCRRRWVRLVRFLTKFASG